MDASIIIPFYNSYRHIKRSLAQSLLIISKNPKIEIIYINDGSTDRSEAIIKENIKKIYQIKLFNLHSNKGPGFARNIGIKKSKAKKILFLDVDDKYNVKNLIDFINSKKNTKRNFFINYKTYPIQKNLFKNNPVNKNFKKNLRKFLLEKNDKSIIFCCFDKLFLLKNKIFFPKGLHEDIIFKFKSLYYSKKPFLKYKKITYLKYNNNDSITGKNFNIDNLNGFIGAWKAVGDFIKRKKLNFLRQDFQFRLRGEYVNLYLLIFKNRKKKQFLQILNKKLLPLIEKNFKPQTKKDYLFKRIT